VQDCPDDSDNTRSHAKAGVAFVLNSIESCQFGLPKAYKDLVLFVIIPAYSQ
jgi:hypothetical protein